MKRIRILLADDHAVARQGFKMILGEQPDMEIVGEAGNGREALQLAESLKPHDRRGAHAPVLALSMHKDSVFVGEILRAVAQGGGRTDGPQYTGRRKWAREV
jgi:two-component system, NarL family, response regulator NreC